MCYFPPTSNLCVVVSHGYVHFSRNAPIEIWIETNDQPFLCYYLLVCPDSYLKMMDKGGRVLITALNLPIEKLKI